DDELVPRTDDYNASVSSTDLLETPREEATPIGDAAYLWRLNGGGELIGSLVKETVANVFIDIGPTIVTIPTNSILERRSLEEAPEETRTTAGRGVGVFDEETGSLVFRSRDSGQEMVSQQEMLDRVKKGVVLVTNPAGLGTGWMLDHSGRIMTNHHVTGREPYQTVTVYVKRGNQWERERFEQSKVVAFSSLHDIAIIQLDMEEVRRRGIDLYPLAVADPTSLEAGDRVFAVGNPGMGAMVLDHTISEGVVSSLARNFNDLIYLQTTAAVNPGNSGGPLVNETGEVVGLVTLKAIFQEGVAFALPSSFIQMFLSNIDAYTVTDTSPNQGFRYHRPR
ncbi:MAG: trypsin-like peptidase domain-containing protein, partial [Candidatus Sumerlaeia bacterium]|nr:trypsin-like peptidase domain-containing protein [Candidatus Sumerlaeia bacterium]